MYGLFRLPLVLALIWVVAVGCASLQTVDSLQRQIEDLQRQNFQLRKEVAEARVRLEMMRESAGAHSGPAHRPTGAAASRPSGEARATELPREGASPAVIYSEPITDPSAYQSPASPRSARGASAAGPGAAPRGDEPSSDPARLMTTARASLDGGDADGALSRFRAIVAGHPEHALADDAQFGVGECYFQMGKYDEAIVEYRKVADLFPFGDQVPYALLKVGFSQLALDQRGVALDSFRTVSEAYPGTEAATVARQQIAHLSRLKRQGSQQEESPRDN
ncbi:MAG: tetratricopeptide repeat protein [Candidatus Rokuibacteriota bacterium]